MVKPTKAKPKAQFEELNLPGSFSNHSAVSNASAINQGDIIEFLDDISKIDAS
jgi:hypothetical protein